MSFVADNAEVLRQTNTIGVQLDPQEPPADPATAVVVVAGSDGPRRMLLHVPSVDLVTAADRLLRARREWLDVPGTKSYVREWCEKALAHLGLPAQLLATLASAGTIQLTFAPHLPESAFQFPWEFVLAKATRRLRGETASRRSFLVFRHLDVSRKPATVPPRSLLIIQKAPGGLGAIESCDSERGLVESALDFESGQTEALGFPNRTTLLDRVTTFNPGIIHVTCVDARQGRALLGIESNAPGSPAPDGVYLEEDGLPAVMLYPELATLLTAGSSPPQLVSFNVDNSTLGAMEVVKSGVGAAIGFEADIDDLVAEHFFSSFYGQWKRSNWDLLNAFMGAWASLATYADKVRGTAIVLWTSEALIEARRSPHLRRVSRTGTGTGTGSGTATGPTAAQKGPDDVVDGAECVHVEYEPPAALNYSLLHNNANIVPKLVIRRQKPGTYRGISVEVKVSAGAQEAAYRASLTLDDDHAKLDLHDQIRVPLTSELIRTLDESLFSTIYLNVRWGRHVLLEKTDPVAFLPVDEWKYDDTNARWLPSFVFPRDPAVREIIAAAQRYLVALRDDSTAGFDGYQSYDPKGVTIGDRSRNIDAQVQAIWWALVHDYSLGYINPPPNYSDEAQRLRTPSEIVGGRRGTCIDLALLLAACLEWVEIYPVVFLLNDHAFPGYWRSEESYNHLSQLSLASTAAGTDMTAAVITEREAHPDAWMTGRGRFAEIATLVSQGHIVPLESVSLTSRSGFWPSVDEGVANLRSRRQFHSMFDLHTARTARKKVTPIPIWSKRV